jgi:hypothetical protein
VLAKRNSGWRDLRVVAVSVFLSVFLFLPWFASFVKPKGFILFARFSTASLTVRTEPERDRPQQK